MVSGWRVPRSKASPRFFASAPLSIRNSVLFLQRSVHFSELPQSLTFLLFPCRVFATTNGCNNNAGGMMKSLILKRSVVLAGHKTSVSLEDAFWRSLKEIAAYQDVTLSALLVSIDSGRDHGNLSSAIRLLVLNFYRDQLEVRERSERVQAMVGRSVPGYT
jgi:predicted DNA-binding ribbon-helix-helix protein